MAKREALLVGILIAFGFGLRVFRLTELMGFDYDQEVAAQAVERILSGKPLLIGQEISVGGVFIGPGYYYLLALWYWLFSGNPIASGIMVAFFSILTMVVLYLLVRGIFGKETALLSLLLFVISAKVNFYDRTTAPSNLIMFLTLAALYILWQMKTGKRWLTPILGATLAGAVLHIHPSTLVIIPLALGLWKYWRLPRPTAKQLFISFASVALMASPLIAFDLRHDFLNAKGLLELFGKHSGDSYFFVLKMLKLARIQMENLAALLLLKGEIGVLVAAAVISIWVRFEKEKKHFLILCLAIPPFVLSFYKGHVPEYYLLTSLPALVILLARAMIILKNRLPAVLIWSAIIVLTGANILSIKNAANPYSLKYKLETVSYIRDSAGTLATVAFDTDYGLDAGLRYLLGKAGIRVDAENPTYTIVIPPGRRQSQGFENIFGGIKVIKSQGD